jgi:hypothetical protein
MHKSLKRLFSIAMLLLFLFNVVGYYLFFLGLRYQANVVMNQRLETADYKVDETITFKVPITVPYYADSKDYERVNGSFEHHGEFFKFVKQKLERDTLYIVCIKDRREKQIFNAMTDFVKLSNDLPSSSQHTLKLLGSLIKDFVPTPSVNTHAGQGSYLALNFIPVQFNLLANDLPVLSPPPDQLV